MHPLSLQEALKTSQNGKVLLELTQWNWDVLDT